MGREYSMDGEKRNPYTNLVGKARIKENTGTIHVRGVILLKMDLR
jgi:hypothetical protein